MTQLFIQKRKKKDQDEAKWHNCSYEDKKGHFDS